MSEETTTSAAVPPFYFEPSRQSPVAILLILMQVIRALISQLWVVFILFLLRPRGDEEGKTDWFTLLGIIGIGAFLLIRALLIYLRTRFYIQDDELIFEKGGLTRSRLSIPLDKIQTITFQQTFLHRIFNVVSVEMDTSGSKGSEITIKALERKKADALRQYLLAWQKNNVSPETGDEAVVVEKVQEKTLLQLDAGALLRVGITQNHLRSAGILIGLGFSFAGDIQPILGKSTYVYVTEDLGLSLDAVWSFALWVTLFFLVISVFATLVMTIIRYYGLRFVRTGEGFRIEAGLFTRREQAAYLPKIQYLRWFANPLQRMLGLLHLQFYQAAGKQLYGNEVIQVPGCYQRQIDVARQAYFPQSDALPWQWVLPHRLHFYERVLLFGGIPLLGLAIKTAIDFSWYWLLLCVVWLPVTIWWQQHLFRHRRYGLSTEGVWVQSGFFTTVQTLLLWQNVQAVVVQQTLTEARYGVADVVFHTASGRVKIASVPQELARELRDYVLAKLEGWEMELAHVQVEPEE